MIRVRGLEQTFRTKRGVVHAVNGVDLDVRPGEIVGLLGPNGAGKTTLLRMLTTLLRPTRGGGTVAGCDLLRDRRGVRRHIGYVAQGGGTSPDNTVREELRFQARVYGMSKHDSQARAAQLIAQLDLAELESRLVRTLSGGQRRRLDIALGLVHSPPLMFLDEPTVGLDPQSRANMWQHVRRLRGEFGTAVVLTTHYLDEADALSDRIVVIDQGRVAAWGTPRELKARVSGDRIVVNVPPEATRATVNLVHRIRGVHSVQWRFGEVSFRAAQGSLLLPVVLRALHEAGVPTLSVQVHQPSLDDVFFAITGRSMREPAEPRVLTHVA